MQADFKLKISSATNLAQVLAAVKSVKLSVAVIGIFNDDLGTLGEIWIKDGAAIIGAHSYVTDKFGKAAFLELFAYRQTRFELMQAGGQPPPEPLNISITELIGNQVALDAAAKPIHEQTSSAVTTPPNARSADEDQIKLPDRFEKNDLAEKRQLEIEEAKRLSAKKAAELNQLSNYSLTPDVDDMALRRTVDLQSAKLNPPSVQRQPDPIDIEPPSFVQQQRNATHEINRSGPILDPLMNTRPEAPVTPWDAPEASHTNLKRFSEWKKSAEQNRTTEPSIELKAFVASKHHVKPEEKVIPRHIWFAISLPAVALPLVTILAVTAALFDSRLSARAEELAAWEVDDAIAQGEPAAWGKKRATMLTLQLKDPEWPFKVKLPDLHSPFRPPDAPVQTTTRTAPETHWSEADEKEAQESAKGPTQQEAAIMVPGISWTEPAVKVPALTVEQAADVAQTMKRAEESLARGALADAAAIYSAAVTKYPTALELRVATINLYMRLRKYDEARTLTMDGARCASSYKNYLVFVSLLKNIPKR